MQTFKKVLFLFSNIGFNIVLNKQHKIMEIYSIIEYLQERSDNETTKMVEKWIKSSDDNLKLAEDIYFIISVNEKVEDQGKIDVKDAYREFCEEYKKTEPDVVGDTDKIFVRQNSKIKKSDSEKISTKRHWSNISYVAAISLLIIVSGLFLSLLIQNNKSQMFTVSTNLGERALVELPDGTQAWLNACSDISYKESLFSRKRLVSLNGEAYFEVVHNKRSPFIVNTDNVNIEVLGTKFNIRNNIDERYITTTLIEGSIKFSNEFAGIDLQLIPGEEMKFNKKDQQYSMYQHSNITDVIGWIDGRLIFRNNTFFEIAVLLEQNYNVRIHFADELVKTERFNADFEISDNIYQIMSILELTNRFKYEINNRDITISSK